MSRAHVEALLRERARQLARPVSQQESEGVDHLLVRVGAVQLAIALTSLRQTVTAGAVTWLPRLPSELRGVRMLRGEVVCVADTAALIGSPAYEKTADQPVVVLEDASPLGLLVDEILGLRRLHVEQAHPPSAVGASTTVPDMLAGVTHDGTLILDTAALLARPGLHLSAQPSHDEGTS